MSGSGPNTGKPPPFVPFNISRPPTTSLPSESSYRQPEYTSEPSKPSKRRVDAYQKAKDDYIRLLSSGGRADTAGTMSQDDDGTDGTGERGDKERARKRSKRSSGKACVYCRRSHMVCEGGRPCERCVKREISHLCRDTTPPPGPHRRRSEPSTASPVQSDLPVQPKTPAQLPSSLYSDPNFPPAWPLLPDTAGPVTYGDGIGGESEAIKDGGMGNGAWGTNDESELGALTKFLGDLGVPSLPGSFLDVLSYFGRGGGNNLSGVPIPGVSDSRDGTPTAPEVTTSTQSLASPRMGRSISNGKGKAKEVSTAPSQLAGVSRIERYFLAAADQPSGPRASRLAQVIKAKYDAGLLKPYDYVKGYERMNKWMDSGRAAPKADSVSASAPGSPQKGGPRNGLSRMPYDTATTPVPVYGSSISPESRRRILAALNGFRPKFRQIARTLTDVDLVFIEEAMERWMLEYDRAFASIHTPSCIWRRTGEIQKANQEFANLTGIPASMFRNGQLCVYELMDEDSAVRFWEGYAKIAFDAGQRSLYISCTLKVPMSLTHRRHSRFSATPSSVAARPPPPQGPIPDLTLPQSLLAGNGGSNEAAFSDTGHGGMIAEEYREIRCSFSVTIRRDAWGVPVAIMGQWIPIQ